MATKTKNWTTGTGSATIQYGGQGDGQIIITSDPNSAYEARTMQITAETTDGSGISRTVTINQAAKQRIDISAAVVTAATQTYSGSAKTPTPTVTLNGNTVPSSGYDVAYSNNTNAGAATITITGKGDYTGTATGTFTINKVTPTVTAPTPLIITYDGSSHVLAQSGATDYGTLMYRIGTSGNWSTSVPSATNHIADGYAVYYMVSGNSNVNSVTFDAPILCNINEKKVTATVVLNISSYTYDGTAHNPSVTVKDGTTVIPASEYTATYSNNINAGEATVTISDNAHGNYEVIGSAKYTINQREVTLTWGTTSWTYDKTAHSTTCTTGNLVSGDTCTVTLTGNSITNKGTATVTASSLSNSNYKLPSSKTNTLTINARTVSLNWGTTSWTYDGSAHGTTCTAGNLCSGDACTVTLNGNSITNAGSTTVTASSLSNSNYQLPSSKSTTLSVSARPINVTAGSTSKTYDGSALTYNSATAEATGTNRGLVSGHCMDSCTVTGSITNAGTGSNVPSAAVIKNANGTTVTTNYSITYVNGTLTVNKASGVAGVSGRSLTYSRNAQNLVTVSGNTGTVHYRLGTSGSWSTSIPTATNADTYTIYYYVDASDNYTAVASSSSPYNVSTTIAKRTPVLSTSPTLVTGLTYTGSAQNLLSGGAMKHSSTNSTVVAGTFTYDQGTNAGDYSNPYWYFTPSDTTNYESTSGYISGSVNIAKANPTYTAPAARSLTYSGSSQYLITTGSTNHGTIQYSANGTSWSDTRPSGTNAGTYTAYWRLVGDSNHNDVASTQISNVDIAQKALTITAKAQSVTYGTAITQGTAQITTSGLISGHSVTAISLAQSTTNVTTTGKITPSAATIKKSSTDVTANYNITYSTGTLTITAATPSYTAPTAKTLTYSGSSQALVNAGSSSDGTFTYKLSTASSYRSSIPTGTNAGNYTVNWKFVADANHGGGTFTGDVSVTISQKSLTITAKAQSISYGSSIATGTSQVTTSGLVSGDSLTAITLTASTSNVTTSGTITPSAASTTKGISNYDVTYSTGNLTITAVPASVTAAPTAKTLTYTGSAQNLVNAGTASGGTMYYKYTTTNSKPTSTSGFSSSIPTRTTAGTYYVWYYVYGDSNHTSTSISSTAVSVTIAKKSRSIYWSSYPSTLNVGQSSSLSAYVSEGSGDGSISYSSSNSNRASVNGSTVTGVSEGTCTIYAYISEGTNYLSASTSYTLEVNNQQLQAIKSALENAYYEHLRFQQMRDESHPVVPSTNRNSFGAFDGRDLQPFVITPKTGFKTAPIQWREGRGRFDPFVWRNDPVTYSDFTNFPMCSANLAYTDDRDIPSGMSIWDFIDVALA